jgi:phosphoglycolate phosphatase
MKTQILKRIGLHGNYVGESSILASGTIEKIAAEIAEVIKLNGDKNIISEILETEYLNFIKENSKMIKPAADLVKLFTYIKKSGYKTGIITADSYEITRYILEYLQIIQYIDFIGTSDIYKEKPDDEMLVEFSRKTGIKFNEIVHVGDTPTDMLFSKKVKYGIGVLSGVGSYETLRSYTEYVVEDVGKIMDEKGRMVWEI